MLMQELVDLLKCQVILGAEFMEGLEVTTCFAADLMSDVLAFSHPGSLLITGLASIQSAHTADVADLAGILFVGGKTPAEPVIALVRNQRIPLLTTEFSMFEVCGRLYASGLEPGGRP
jgi:predicted transcriptional regulator